MIERKVLGKGLDVLIPKKITPSLTKEFTYLPLEKISPGKYQPRQEIDQKELEELSCSIKEKGILQPIIVRKIGEENYEVVAGGRRYYAAKLLGLKEIPTIIRDLNDKDALALAIIENLQRKDLNPIEEAEAFRRLIEEFSLSQDEVAKLVSKDKTTVVNTLRLLKLPLKIQEAVKKGLISKTQARTILSVEEKELQEKLFYDILNQKLSVREIEHRVKKISLRKKPEDPFVLEIEEKLQKILGTKVRIFNRKNNTGKIVIEYYSLEDLERIIKKF